MATKDDRIRLELDWSRLLGFDQVAPEARERLRKGAEAGREGQAPALAAIGGKVGGKPGVKQNLDLVGVLAAKVGNKD